MKTKNILATIIFILTTTSTFATSYTWTGATDTVFAKTTNWNPSTGYPGATDTAIIVSQSNMPTLAGNQTVMRLEMPSGTFDLKGHEFTVQGSSRFSGGTIGVGTLIIRGTAAIFSGCTIKATLDAYCDRIELNGGIFNESCIFTTTGLSDSPGSGGCVFVKEVTIVHNGTYKKVFRMGMTSGDEFNGKLTITNSSNGRLSLSEADTTFFNGKLELNNNGTSIIQFSYSGGVSQLASGNTIVIGTTGYAANELILYKFIQNGTPAQSITLTGTAKLYLKNCEFNGAVTITAPELFCGSSIFNNTCQITKTGSHTNYWYGNNIFNGTTTITNHGTGGTGDELRLAATLPNFYNSNAVFQSSGKPIQVVWEGGSNFQGDISKNDSSITFHKGITTLTGSNAQSLEGSRYFDFNDLVINKPSEHATANIPLEISGLLDLTSGNLVTDSLNLLTMTAGSFVAHASNSSFVDGPVKKVGDIAFEFPVGKANSIFPLTISSPSNSTDSYTCEYLNSVQTYGSGLDSTLYNMSDCDYWTLSRTSGTSSVYVKLYWKDGFCHSIDTNDVRVASFYSGGWHNEGNTDNGLSNELFYAQSSVAQSNYNAFSLAYIHGGNSCQSAFSVLATELCTDSIHVSQNKEIWFSFNSDSLALETTVFNKNVSYGEYFVQKVALYQGNCGYLRKLGEISKATFLDSLKLIINNLDTSFSKQYYIKITKKDTCSGCTSDTVKFAFCLNEISRPIIPFIQYTDICGLNYTTGTIQLNQRVSPASNPATGSTFPATITVTPPGTNTQIIGAFLYMSCVGDAAPDVTNATITTSNGSVPLALALIDTDVNTAGTCWVSVNPNFDHTFSYRANVLPVITNTNNNYEINGLLANNNIDWNGVTLIIIYTDCNGNSRKASLYLEDGLQVIRGGGSFVSTINYTPNSTNTYISDQGIINTSDVESFQGTAFAFGPGTTAPPANLVIQNNFYSLSTQNGGIVTPPSGNVSSYEISSINGSEDCYAVNLAGIYFQEADATCAICSCDENETYCFSNLTVTASDTWTALSNPGTSCNGGIITIQNELTINADVILTLNGVTLRFGPDGKIVVRRGGPGTVGGKLIIKNQSLLTAVNNSCMWQGIEVWGRNTLQNNDPQQGYLLMEFSEIRYAHNAIYVGRRTGTTNNSAYTGGVIEVIKFSTFRDNNVSIRFPLGFTLGRKFNIVDNEFLAENPLRNPIYNQERSQYFIDINRENSNPYNAVSYVGISRNIFHNTPSNWQNRTRAIRAYWTIALPIIDNDFYDVNIGVQFLGSGYRNLVDVTNFMKNCNLGIWNRNNSWNEFKNTTIHDGVGLAHTGIFNQNGFATIIRDNFIDNFRDGITVINSNSLNGTLKIWENQITNTNRPLLAGGNNWNSMWYCNILDGYINGNGVPGRAWSIYNFGTSPGLIANQGINNLECPSNEFKLINPNTRVDIFSNNSTNTFNYFSTSAGINGVLDPDVTTPTLVFVTYNITGLYGGAFCSSLPTALRGIDEILAQRDTSYTDSLLLANLNAEVVKYYLSVTETDSLIAFFDSLSVSYADPYRFEIYLFSNNIDSLRAIMSRWPSGTQDEQDLKDFFDLYCDLADDTLTFSDLTVSQRELIDALAENDNLAGELAKDVLNVIADYPLIITCEMTNSCEGNRMIMNPIILDPKIVNEKNREAYPNPASENVVLKLSENGNHLQLIVYNQLNQVILTENITKFVDAIVLNVKKLQNGTYYYCIKNIDGCDVIGKFVVLH